MGTIAQIMNAKTKNSEKNYIRLFETGMLKIGTKPEGKGLALLIDMDDLWVNMADKQQEMIDKHEFANGVRFKTKTIKMLEQQVRNCRYIYSKIKSECEKAEAENRTPDIAGFPTFNKYKFNPRDPERYKRPIEIAHKYLRDATALYNQFFEERDTFLEIDNLHKGEKIKFDLKREHRTIEKYRRLILADKLAFSEINEYCLGEVRRISREAKGKYVDGKPVVPDYGELIRMDSNDVLKKGDLNIENSREVEKYKEYVLYEKPEKLLQNCVDEQDSIMDIVTNEAVYSMACEEVIDFKAIYSIENINGDAVRFARSLIESGLFALSFIATHGTGGREAESKDDLGVITLPEADGIIYQMFHKYKHNGKKRLRDSKVDFSMTAIMSLAPILGEEFVSKLVALLLDDSTDNIVDAVKKGALGIQYKPVTDAEIIKGFDEMIAEMNEVKDKNLKEALQYLRITKFNEGSFINKEVFSLVCFMILERVRQMNAEDTNTKSLTIKMDPDNYKCAA